MAQTQKKMAEKAKEVKIPKAPREGLPKSALSGKNNPFAKMLKKK